jgi:hypothetical protein
VYCNANIEDTKLTLDHLTPYSQGGSNDASNLVTACLRCNSSRGVRSVEDFAAAVAGYLNGGTTPESITDFIALTVTRPLNVNAAREIIMNRREEVTEWASFITTQLVALFDAVMKMALTRAASFG